MVENDNIWVFAYGSLCWRPGFVYEEVLSGFISGYNRRFWQGNFFHRGTREKPGRVATLVPAKDARTWGTAYKINSQNQSHILEYLENREMKLGGYVCVLTEFFPLSVTSRKQCKGDAQEEEEMDENKDSRAIPCLCYVAENSNPFWLGEESEMVIASEVRDAHGSCGPNSDYVLSLYKYMKTTFPFFKDDHLESIVKYL